MELDNIHLNAWLSHNWKLIQFSSFFEFVGHFLYSLIFVAHLFCSIFIAEINFLKVIKLTLNGHINFFAVFVRFFVFLERFFGVFVFAFHLNIYMTALFWISILQSLIMSACECSHKVSWLKEENFF